MPKNLIAELQACFNFIRNCQKVLRTECAMLHPHQCVRVPVAAHAHQVTYSMLSIFSNSRLVLWFILVSVQCVLMVRKWRNWNPRALLAGRQGGTAPMDDSPRIPHSERIAMWPSSVTSGCVAGSWGVTRYPRVHSSTVPSGRKGGASQCARDVWMSKLAYPYAAPLLSPKNIPPYTATRMKLRTLRKWSKPAGGTYCVILLTRGI